MIERVWLAIAGLYGAAAVSADAAASHLLADTPARAELARTAAHYGLIHAVALAAAAALWRGGARGAAAVFLLLAGWCFLAGTTFFSGALLLLAAGAPHGVARLAPIGGSLLIVGWLALFLHALAPRRAGR